MNLIASDSDAPLLWAEIRIDSGDEARVIKVNMRRLAIVLDD